MTCYCCRTATTVAVIDVTGATVNLGVTFSAQNYSIAVSEGVPIGASVFDAPVSHS